MVDVVGVADAVIQIQNVADRCNDVSHYYMLRRKFVLPLDQSPLQFILRKFLVQYLLKHRIIDLVCQLKRLGIKIYITRDIYELASDYLCFYSIVIFSVCHYEMYTCIFDNFAQGSAYGLPFFSQDLTCIRIDYVLRRDYIYQSV